MTKKVSSKRALLTSAVALLMCISMFIGTTFAWFTDSVTTVNNKIVAGNLDVNLYYSTDAAAWTEVNSDTNIFTESLWEPGRTEVVYLKVVNEGTLALKYVLNVNIAHEQGSVNVDGEEFELSDFIEYGITPVTAAFASRSAAKSAVSKNAMGLKESYAPGSQILYPVNSIPEGGVSEVIVAMVVYMPENVGNDANYAKDAAVPTIDLGINLLATQVEYEGDSFGTDYDANADYTIQAGDSMEMLNQHFDDGVINNGTLTMNGGSISNGSWGFENNGTATLNNVIVTAGSASHYGVVLNSGSTTTLNDVTIDSAGGAIGVEGGAQAVFNSGSVTVNTTSTSGRYLFYVVGEGSKLTINGGSFDWDRTQNQKRAYIYAGEGATVEINGGMFGKASTRSGYTDGILGNGTVIIRGGTFGFNPTKWLASGYQAIKDGANWIVVPENVDVIVDDVTELQAALDSATGDYVIFVNGDITGNVTATQKENVKVTINGNGNEFVGVITVNGQSRRYDTAALTIRNFNFNAESISTAAYINLGVSGDSNTRYTNHVTVENCTFSYTGEGDAVAIKSYTGGDWNLTVSGCIVNAGLHSMLQVTNVEKGLTITDCKVYSKNGINLNNTPYLNMSGCEFNTIGYCVRVGVSGATNNGTFTISNSTLTSANDDGDAVIIFRGTMSGATLNLVETMLNGDPQTSGVN